MLSYLQIHVYVYAIATAQNPDRINPALLCLLPLLGGKHIRYADAFFLHMKLLFVNASHLFLWHVYIAASH